MVINEYLKFRFNNGFSNNAFFYRDREQNEIDLLIKTANNYTLIEIKSSKTYHNSFRSKLDWLHKQLPDTNVKKIVVYDGTQEWQNEEISILNYQNFIQSL